jgi:hypothetical protein
LTLLHKPLTVLMTPSKLVYYRPYSKEVKLACRVKLSLWKFRSTTLKSVTYLFLSFGVNFNSCMSGLYSKVIDIANTVNIAL